MRGFVTLECDTGIANCTNLVQSSCLRLHFQIQETLVKRFEYILCVNAEQLRGLPALLKIDTTFPAGERNRGLRSVGLQLSYPDGLLVRCCQRTWTQEMRSLRGAGQDRRI